MEKLREIVRYHDNGNIKERYTVNEYNEREGIYQSFYETGQIELETSYKDDEKTGVVREWSKDGFLFRVYLLEDGKKVKDPFFVVDDNVYIGDEYLVAYNSGNDEFKKKDIKGFKHLSDAYNYISKSKNKQISNKNMKKIENNIEF